MAKRRDHPDWDEYFKKRDALGDDIEPVIRAAGIQRQLERLEDHLMPDWCEDRHLPPLLTDAWRKSKDEQDEARWSTRNCGLRKIVFGVKDADARKKLITYYRRQDLLWIEFSQETWRQKVRELDALRKNTFRYGFIPPIVAGVCVGGMTAGSTPAAGLGMLAFAIVFALYDIKHREQKRRVAIREKAAEVAAERASVNASVARQVFTQREEDTGRSEKEIADSLQEEVAA